MIVKYEGRGSMACVFVFACCICWATGCDHWIQVELPPHSLVYAMFSFICFYPLSGSYQQTPESPYLTHAPIFRNLRNSCKKIICMISAFKAFHPPTPGLITTWHWFDKLERQLTIGIVHKACVYVSVKKFLQIRDSFIIPFI